MREEILDVRNKTQQTSHELTMDRRHLFKLGVGLAAVPVMGLVGCDGGNTTDTSSHASDGETHSERPTNGQRPGGNSSGGSSTAQYCEYTTNTSEWATGGVKNLTVNFPQTSIFNSSGSTCSVTMSDTTLGPCFFAVETGEDISGSKDGLPMQVCLQIVDSSCNPITNAQVEIWHCDRAGVYSADTSNSSESGQFAGSFCSGGNEEANNAKWFRGVLNTDREGRVNFKTCFPGWYASRTAHIHFRIKTNNQVSLVSQLCFEDTLTQEIYTKHPAYSCRGNQDTPLSSGDNVFGQNYQAYIMKTQKNSDKSMLVYKRIVLS